MFCWAKVSPSQHLFLVKLQIYILFLGMFWNFYNWNFYNWSICRWLLLGVTSHYTAIFHFPWYNREQYDIQHHNLIEDLLQKQSNIRALRKSYFETFWKLTEALLRWKTFKILKFLVANIVFLFHFYFLFWEAETPSVRLFENFAKLQGKRLWWSQSTIEPTLKVVN